MLFFPLSLLINFRSFYFLQRNISRFSNCNATVSYSFLPFTTPSQQEINFLESGDGGGGELALTPTHPQILFPC